MAQKAKTRLETFFEGVGNAVRSTGSSIAQGAQRAAQDIQKNPGKYFVLSPQSLNKITPQPVKQAPIQIAKNLKKNLWDVNPETGKSNALAALWGTVYDTPSALVGGPTRKIFQKSQEYGLGKKPFTLQENPFTWGFSGIGEGLRDATSNDLKRQEESLILRQLPEKIGMDPDSWQGKLVGLGGEILMPGFGEIGAITKATKGTRLLKLTDLASNSKVAGSVLPDLAKLPEKVDPTTLANIMGRIPKDKMAKEVTKVLKEASETGASLRLIKETDKAGRVTLSLLSEAPDAVAKATSKLSLKLPKFGAKADDTAKAADLTATSKVDVMPEGLTKAEQAKWQMERALKLTGGKVADEMKTEKVGDMAKDISTRYISPEAQEAMDLIAKGAKKSTILRDPKYAAHLQEISQRMANKGLLADLDNAILAKNFDDVPRILDNMLNDATKLGKESPYFEFLTPKNIENYVSSFLSKEQVAPLVAKAQALNPGQAEDVAKVADNAPLMPKIEEAVAPPAAPTTPAVPPVGVPESVRPDVFGQTAGPSITGGRREVRGLAESILDQEGLPPTFQREIAASPELYYGQKALDQTQTRAVQYLDSKPLNDVIEQVYQGKFDPGISGDEAVAIQGEVVRRLLADGDDVQATNVALHSLKSATEVGRAANAYKLWNFTTQGLSKSLQRAYDDMNKAQPRVVEKATREAQDVLNKLTQADEDATQGFVNAADKVVKRIVERTKGVKGKLLPEAEEIIKKQAKQLGKAAEKVEKVPEEKLATRIEKAARQPKQLEKTVVDEMISTLYGVAKETLPKKDALPDARTPEDIMSLAMSQRETYAEVWTKAQDLVKEKVAKAIEELQSKSDVDVSADDIYVSLDKYFETYLTKPFSERVLNKSLKKTLVELQTDLKAIARESRLSQSESVETIMQRMLDKGWYVTKEDYADLATIYKSKVVNELSQTKTRILNAMFGEKAAPEQVGWVQRLTEISNMGGLHREDLLPYIGKRYKLAYLTPDTARLMDNTLQEIQKLTDPAAKNQMLYEMFFEISKRTPASLREKAIANFHAFRYQNMLSGIKTQARNIGPGGIMTSLVATPSLLLSDAVAQIPKIFQKKMRTAKFGDVLDYYGGMAHSLGRAKSAFADAWKNFGTAKNPYLDYAETTTPEQIFKMARQQQLPNKNFTYITRFMEGTDRFFSELITGGLTAKFKSDGLSGPEAVKEARKLSEGLLMRQSMGKEARGVGPIADLITMGGDYLSRATKAGGALNPLQYFIPFIRIATNQSKLWYQVSPAGWADILANAATGKVSADKLQVAKATLGTALFGMGLALASDDRLTWNVPKSGMFNDDEASKLFYDSGRKPYSVKVNIPGVGEQWVPLATFGPLAYPFIMAAAYKYHMFDSPQAPQDHNLENADEIMKALMKGTWGSMTYVTNQSYMEGLKNVIDILTGEVDASFEKSLGFMATQIRPVNGFIRDLNNYFIDPTIRKSRGFMDEFINKNMPLLSQELPAYKTSIGEDAKREWWNILTPYDVGSVDGGYDVEYKIREDELKMNYQLNEMERKLENGDIDGFLKDAEAAEVLGAQTQAPEARMDNLSYSMRVPTVTGESMDAPSVEQMLKVKSMKSRMMKMLSNEAFSKLSPEKQDRILKKYGVTREEAYDYKIKSLETDQKAVFYASEIAAGRMTIEEIRRHVDREIFTDNVVESMAGQGLITPDEVFNIKQMIAQRKSETNTLKDKDPMYIGKMLTADPTRAMELIKLEVLTDSLVNDMLIRETITPEFGAQLKDMIDAYYIEKGVRKPKGTKKKKAPSLKLSMRATSNSESSASSRTKLKGVTLPKSFFNFSVPSGRKTSSGRVNLKLPEYRPGNLPTRVRTRRRR